MGAFTFDGGLTFWTLVTFACLLALLAKFVFKPFKKLLDEREQRIRDALEKSDRAREEAGKILDQNREQIDGARKEARHIIEEGHRIVAEMKNEAKDSAQRETDAAVARARTEIERQTQRSLDDLKGTVAGLSVRIARQVIGENLDETRHEELANNFIERLKKSHAARKS